jgi:hypothetical protein
MRGNITTLKIKIYREIYHKKELEEAIFLPEFKINGDAVGKFSNQLQDLIDNVKIKTNVKLRK